MLGILSFLFSIVVFAQGDAVSGTWTGDWGPSPGDRNNVTVDLKWDGKALSGNVTSGTNVTSAIPLQKTTYDAKTGAIHMEADASSRGRTVHYVIDGKVEKGSMTGSWNHDNRKGDFKLAKK
jgi:hypothetical protein